MPHFGAGEQGAELHGVSGIPLLIEWAEISFCRFSLPHFGQEGTSLLRTSVSKRSLHSRHWYS